MFFEHLASRTVISMAALRRDFRLPTTLSQVFYKTILLTIVVAPILTFWLVLWRAPGHYVNRWDLLLLVGNFVPPAAGITVGFHRYFTHGSFRAKLALVYIMGILGMMAIEGAITDWVRKHRRHHEESEQIGRDPHTPMEGLFHAHVGWLFDDAIDAPAERYARDLLKQPEIRRMDKWFIPVAIFSIVYPIIWGWDGFIFGSMLRILLVHHFSWSINSICHTFGDQPFETGDNSRDCKWLLIPSLGESGHNKHHAFQSDALHGRCWWQDISYMLIKALQLCRLVSNVQRTPQQLLLRKLRAGHERAWLRNTKINAA